MFGSFKAVAIFYFIAFVICVVTFFGSHKWGYLIAAAVWLVLGIYCIVRDRDDNGLR